MSIQPLRSKHLVGLVNNFEIGEQKIRGKQPLAIYLESQKERTKDEGAYYRPPEEELQQTANDLDLATTILGGNLHK
jgi:hypothetical protein